MVLGSVVIAAKVIYCVIYRFGQNIFMPGKKKNHQDGSSIMTVSDRELRYPEEKMVKEVSASESSLLLDSSSD